MHAGEPVTERAQPLAGELEGGRVAVDADHAGQLAPGQHRLGVPAQAERAVDHDGSVVVECGRQKGDDPVEEDRDVVGAAHGRA